MAKIKVHELAKEVDRQSKEVIAFLQNKGIEVKAAQSSVEDSAAEMVRQEMKKKAEVAFKEMESEIMKVIKQDESSVNALKEILKKAKDRMVQDD